MIVDELIHELRTMRTTGNRRAEATALIHEIERFSLGTEVEFSKPVTDVVSVLNKLEVVGMVDGKVKISVK